MAKKKKKKSGEINFYKAMTILGLIIAGAIVYGFLVSAPKLSKTAFHNEAAPIKQCLQCHMVDPGKNPVMPHRQMGNCTLCHRPE